MYELFQPKLVFLEEMSCLVSNASAGLQDSGFMFDG